MRESRISRHCLGCSAEGGIILSKALTLPKFNHHPLQSANGHKAASFKAVIKTRGSSGQKKPP